MDSLATTLVKKPYKTGLFLFVSVLAALALAISIRLARAEESVAEISLAGGNTAGCVLVDGGLRCWGTAVSTGTGSGSELAVPTWASGLQSGVASASLGSGFGCAVLESGAAKCWGYNNMGQLGDGTSNASLVPVNVIGLPDGVKQIATGYTHSCALLNNGQVWCWGNNANYQLGREGWSSSTPTQVASPLGGAVRSLAAGAAHTCALLETGAVQCWGYGFYGSLGNGSTADTPIPQNVLGLAGKVTRLEAGYVHTCALLETGAVQCWGLFGSFSANRATTLPAFGTGNLDLAANGGHLCVLDSIRKARCQGGGTAGQLGDGTKTDSNTPVEVSGLSGGITDISAGHSHTCAVWNGQVYCWGGILGTGGSNFTVAPWRLLGLPASATPLSAGNSHACAVTGGAAYCWGGNLNGALGIGVSDGQNYPSPQPVLDASANTTRISAGTQYTCAVINGAAKCWGRNEYGQLGNGTQTEASRPTQVIGLASGMGQVYANRSGGGQVHTCATTTGGAAYCWGGNYAGQLGSGAVTTLELSPVPVVGLGGGVSSMALGVSHTCAAYNGAALCWGFGYNGEIGNGISGTYDKYPTPQSVIGLGSGVTQVAAGSYFTCALANGGVKCWGKNESGQLGNNTTASAATPVQVSGLESGVTAISAGSNYACALAGGAVKCWGATPLFSSLTPQTVRYLESGVLELAAGNVILLVRTGDGIYGLGSNNHSILGAPIAAGPAVPQRLLGFGPSPELRLQAALARPGSTLHVAGGGFPPNTRLPLRANGRDLGSVFSDGLGYFSLVVDTQGQAAGAYTFEVLFNGAPIQVSFNLDPAAALIKASNGGVYVSLSAVVAEPTPVPSPTPNPYATPLPAAAPRVSQVVHNSGDRAIPTRVEIYGANFKPGAVARLRQGGGEIPALETLYVSANHLQVTWPGGLAAGLYDVIVLNPDWSRGELTAAYLAMDVAAAPGSDLYGVEDELGPEGGAVTAGQNVNFSFVLRRLGGTANLSNVRVRLYYGETWVTNPLTQGTLMGEVNTPSLAPNQWAQIQVNYPAPAAGAYLLFAVIDPANAVVETNEANNTVVSRFSVAPDPNAPPPDFTPPVVDSVTTAGLWTGAGSALLTVSAHDDPGGSGVSWVYIFTWEYFPGLRDWLVTNESGWLPYDPGASSQAYPVSFGYFEGPRIFSVYVADRAENVSREPAAALINYVRPSAFIFPGESHLFAFPLAAGEIFTASLQNLYPDNDADLYLWPPDYPSRPYWSSTRPGDLPEGLAVTIPVSGWYWLEVYGYSYGYYNLNIGIGGMGGALEMEDAPVDLASERPRTTPLALGQDEPNQKAILPTIPRQFYLPMIRR